MKSRFNSTKKNRFGLVDLFGGNRWVRPPRETSSRSDSIGSINGTFSGNWQTGPSIQRNNEQSKFFTFRMEYRHGGTVAKHAGEERFLLFRSDQAGAIAKVVFSSSPIGIDDTVFPRKKNFADETKLVNTRNNPNKEIFIVANAKVHVLFVKDAYRGFNLGGFLFVLCTTYLRECYYKTFHSQFWNRPTTGRIPSVRCSLDAEEDVRRHDKLVQFYEHLGLRRRRSAKTIFLNNNDGETYRRIPMKIDLLVPSCEREPSKPNNDNNNHHFAVAYSSFLPVVLKSLLGESARLDDRRIDSWLIAESEDGNILLHTTDGRILRMDEWGDCQLALCHGGSFTRSSDASLESFQLLRVSDMLDKVLYDKEEEYKEEQSCIQDKLLQQQQQKYHLLAKEKELWMIRSSVHGTFMGLTHKNDLVFSEEASFWQADENFCLTHTFDSPARRQHHRRMWMKQSVEYATRMQQRYSVFDLHRMTIEEALNLTKHLQANPFLISIRREQDNTSGRMDTPSTPSFRTYLFHTAELARKEGHPDWVQFVALVHGLASALTCVGSGSIFPIDISVKNDEEDFDWTIYVDTRVMGCKASKHSTFAEFRHLNPDEVDTRYNTRTGVYREHVGLERVLTSWTGSDYVYFMLKHNRVRLPKEAYAILKLFPLVDWHSRGLHTALSNDDDEELKLFVADFYDMRQRSHDMILSNDTREEMGDKECKELWANHYSLIANKYGAGDILEW